MTDQDAFKNRWWVIAHLFGMKLVAYHDDREAVLTDRQGTLTLKSSGSLPALHRLETTLGVLEGR